MYKTLPNDLQLQATDKTTITEIAAMPSTQDTFSFLSLDHLESTPINTVVGKTLIYSFLPFQEEI